MEEKYIGFILKNNEIVENIISSPAKDYILWQLWTFLMDRRLIYFEENFQVKIDDTLQIKIFNSRNYEEEMKKLSKNSQLRMLDYLGQI